MIYVIAIPLLAVLSIALFSATMFGLAFGIAWMGDRWLHG
jgi:hypothetical protein